ncbi:NUDIX domain-containing protein [Vibrio owensii]|uniref:NUDIX domain-containing protein n=1 Tax=Vibrio harveyi group TaxID=717610 RepID=UPI003CC5E7EE
MSETGKKLSCGIIFVDKHNQMLMLHSATYSHWDIPKGTQSDGETPIQTAIRETREETGITVNPDDLIELGLYHYNRFKDLWLFFIKVDNIELDRLKCTSMVFDDLGAEVPEADEFELYSMDQVEDYMCYSMKVLYDHELRRHVEIEINRTETKNISYDH